MVFIFYWLKIEIPKDRNCGDVIGLNCKRSSEETEKSVESFISCSFSDSDWMKVVAFDPYCVTIVKIFISVKTNHFRYVQSLSRSSESFCFVLKKNQVHL